MIANQPKHYTLHELPYGLKDGEITHVEDVSKGLACGCVCPACGSPLVAKKGSHRLHHFAHAHDTSCGAGLETGLHLAAKRILDDKRRIVLPPIRVKFPNREDSYGDAQHYQLDDVRLEKKTGDIRPDVVAYIRGKPLLIEICVTNAVDDEKLMKIGRLGIGAIEINLRKAPRRFTHAQLEELVIFGEAEKKWLYNERAERKRESIVASATKRCAKWQRIDHVIPDCPLKQQGSRSAKRYADFTYECPNCKHALEIDMPMEWVRCDAPTEQR
ncbi:MAG: competence protein CoiA family protein [Sedimenticolaceae bacterium]